MLTDLGKQDEDTAYIALMWRHIPLHSDPEDREKPTPNMSEMADAAREHPIRVTIGIPELQFSAGDGTNKQVERKELVFAEFEIQCR